MENENMVQIPMSEYRELLEIQTKFKMLYRKFQKDSAYLSDSDCIMFGLKSSYPKIDEK